MNDRTKFRQIFVVEPSHDVRALSQYTGTVIFLTEGKEDVKDLPHVIAKNLEQFDPDSDAIVPVGRVITALETGFQLGRLFGNRTITMGVFRDGDYTFARIQL